MTGRPAVREVLAVNAGSTSLKISLVRDDGSTITFPDLPAALGATRPDAVVHRVVHGGHRHRATVLDDAVLAGLRALTELVPLHQPPALRAIDQARRGLPDVPHVACFDTAFHRTIPPAASTYALPPELRETLRVNGFHGISHAWAASRVARVAPGARRLLVAHLGGGASLCAVRDGVSVDTTMGFTPLDGLVMATRGGRLDPGAVLWLARHGHDVADLDDLLNRRSGLLALAGTGDLREVLRRRAAGDERADLAFEVYLHRLTTCAGAMVAAMGGLDAIAFTGGVGQGCHPVREELCARLAWLGVRIRDEVAPPDGSDREATELTADQASVRTFVVPAREDLRMAEEARAALGPEPAR
jgi:acetate kinase